MTDTKYAVVIVTYNRENLLRECVDNVERQTAAPDSIIIVNNASTDNTSDYLEELNYKDGRFDIMNLPHNIGGAGGFAKGIERALHKNVDCILIIDDDAMIAIDYMELILRARQHNTQYKAFAGTLKTDGEIDTFHRRNLQRTGLMSKNCKELLFASLRYAFKSDCGKFMRGRSVLYACTNFYRSTRLRRVTLSSI